MALLTRPCLHQRRAMKFLVSVILLLIVSACDGSNNHHSENEKVEGTYWSEFNWDDSNWE